MSHLSLVPPLPDARPTAPRAATPRALPRAYEDPKVVALGFFQAASGICLCRTCSMKRHPAYATT